MTERFQDLEQFIFDKMAKTKIPGLSIVVTQNGAVLYRNAFGYRNIERGLPATPNTLYGIASMTKSFTCLAVMQLQEQGKLDIEDRVDAYLPFTVKGIEKPIKIWHLMSHASGLPGLGLIEAALAQQHKLAERWLPLVTNDGGDNLMAFLEGANDWIRDQPGSVYYYSNEAYETLGALVSTVSGQPYTEYVRDRILRPLGMERSIFSADAFANDPETAQPYLLPPDGPQRPGTYCWSAYDGSAGLISSVDELTRYLDLLIARANGEEGDIVSAASVKEMIKPRSAPREERVQPGKAPGSRKRLKPASLYGFGLNIREDFFGQTLIGHSGSVLSATGYYGFIPEKRLGVAVLANGAGYAKNFIGQYAMAVALGANPAELPFVHDDQLFDRITGRYEGFRGLVQMKVSRAGGFLQISDLDFGELEYSFQAAPLSLNQDRPRFFTYADGTRSIIEFDTTADPVEMVYERYRLRRVGPDR